MSVEPHYNNTTKRVVSQWQNQKVRDVLVEEVNAVVIASTKRVREKYINLDDSDKVTLEKREGQRIIKER